MSVLFEKEICAFLNIPSVPKKKWDGNTSFAFGVAIINLTTGGEAYAVASFDKEKDNAPKVTKVFSLEPFIGIKDEDIYIVPEYMNTDGIEQWDMDEESKQNAQRLIEEVKEMENDDFEKEEKEELPEWIFPEITNKEEAIAWVRNYRSRNKIKGKIPTSEESLKAYLYVLYSNNKRIK